MRLRTLPSLLALAFLAPLADAGPTIAGIAPRNTALILAADRAGEAIDAAKRSSLTSLWTDPQFEKYLTTLLGGTLEDLLEPWKAAGIELDELQPPVAAIGAAWFFAPADGLPPGVEDMNDGADSTQLLLIADYTGAAEGAAATMEDSIERLIKKAVTEETAKTDLLTYGPHEITRLAFKQEDPTLPAEPMMGEEGDDQDVFFDDGSASPDGFPPILLIARVNDVFLACSHLKTLHDAIDRVEGKDLGETADDNPDYAAALDMLGARAEQHATIVIYPKTFIDAMRQGFDALPMLNDGPGFLDAAPKIFTALGIDQIRAVSSSIRFDTPDAAARYTVALLSPTKTGLLSLINTDAAPLAPPAFIPPDAASLTSVRVNFAAVVPLVRAVTAAAAEDQDPGMDAMMDQFLATISTVMNSLAGDVHMASRITQPYSPSSRNALFAVAVKDPQTLTQALAGFAQGFFGFTPRDYLGHQLWEMRGMADMAFAVGSGWLFAGTTASVEDALREASNPDRPKLADDPAFINSTRAVAGPAVAHSWTRIRPMIEYAAWTAENYDRILEEQVRGFGLDPEQEKEYLEMMREYAPASARTPVPADAILRHVGDSVGNLRATPEGFVGQGLILRPAR